MSPTKFIGIILLATVAASGCRSRLNRSQATGQPSASTGTAPGQTASPSPPRIATPGGRRDLTPVGLPHAITPGLGLGPVMFGTNLANLERHMRMKCEELTPTRCRMIRAGAEFDLKDGVVSGIQIHRFDRPVEGNPSALWGVFAGGVPPDVRMTMVPEAVIQSLGAPLRTEVVSTPNPYRTVRRDYYNGMILDYDHNPENDRLMLGGIRIVKKQ